MLSNYLREKYFIEDAGKLYDCKLQPIYHKLDEQICAENYSKRKSIFSVSNCSNPSRTATGNRTATQN